MAVVDLNSNNTVNADGLNVYYGLGEAITTRAGEFQMSDGTHVTEVIIDLATLPTAASGNEQIVADNVCIPNGAFIEKVEVLVLEEPVTSGSPNLDLGLVDQDRTTEIDFNGLLAAADAFETGTDLGVVVTYYTDTTESGALVGTQITNTGLITASPDTADWTDGTLRVRIFWYVPLTADL
jgi:hypothetical protein